MKINLTKVFVFVLLSVWFVLVINAIIEIIKRYIA